MPNTPTLATLADDLESGRTTARKLVEACIAKIADASGEGQRTFIHVDREAAIDLNAMLRTDKFPPLDLGTDGVAAPRPIWSAPPKPGPIAGFFGAKSRHEQRLAAAHEKFELAELEYERAEAARQERIRERTSRYEAALLAHQNDIARDNSRIAQISAAVRERDRENVQYYLELALSRFLAGTAFFVLGFGMSLYILASWTRQIGSVRRTNPSSRLYSRRTARWAPRASWC